MIAAALDKVGSNGVLSIEASNSTETFVEVQEGMAVDRGYISPQFVTNSERLLVEFDNCRVLVTDQKIEAIRDIVPILEQVCMCRGGVDHLSEPMDHFSEGLIELVALFINLSGLGPPKYLAAVSPFPPDLVLRCSAPFALLPAGHPPQRAPAHHCRGCLR